MAGKFSLAERNRLIDNLLIIDGISRAGKFFFGNLIEGIEGVDRAQYLGLLEHLPYLNRLNLVGYETAKAIIVCQVDNSVYERAIGRNMNFHFDDKTSIL